MADDTETLAEVLMDALCESVIWQDRHVGELEWHLCDGIAERILASSWLAARDAAVAERALRDAADGVETLRMIGVNTDLAAWLRARADAIATGDPS